MPGEEQQRTRHNKDFKIGERVLIQQQNKRSTVNVKGQVATVIELPGNGWVMAQIIGSMQPPIRIQQRYLRREPLPGQLPVLQPAAADNAMAAVAPAATPTVADLPFPQRQLTVRIAAPPAEAAAKPAGGAPANVGGGATPCTRGEPGAQQMATPAAPAVTPGMLREVLRKLRAAETVPDLAQRLQEFRQALVTDAASFLGCGATWQVALDNCLSGSGTHAMLLGVWEELRQAIGAWLDVRARPAGQQSASMQACAERAVAALQRAAKHGPDALAQIPLEAIVNYSADGLQAVRAMVEKDRKAAVAKVAEYSGAFDTAHAAAAAEEFSCQMHPANMDTSDGGATYVAGQVDGFDSGAETEDEGSDITGMAYSSDDSCE